MLRLEQPRRKRAHQVHTALLLAVLSALIPGSGHLVLGRRIGYLILTAFLPLISTAGLVAYAVPRDKLLEYALSAHVLGYAIGALPVIGLLWLLVIIRTYILAAPRRVAAGQRLAGGFLVTMLAAATLTPFGYAAYTANTQRNLLNTLFPGVSGSEQSTGDAIHKPRVNLLLIGSDAGPGRVGTRTDTMMVASIDTTTGRTTLFSLPRNLRKAQFPAGSKLAEWFPDGFTDPRKPGSPEYMLNALYTYGNDHPDLAPPKPSKIAGLNVLAASIATMLGLQLDYYIQVNMAGFTSIIDALGGLDVNVGPQPVPIGGIGVHGEAVKPFGYIPAGHQHLTGNQALWYARSRTNADDYSRMGRQRCLLKYIVDQKSPLDVLSNFQAVATATSSNVITNIPQDALPTLVQLAMKAKNQPLESISFDPRLPDPNRQDGWFNTAHPDFSYMRQVVQNTINPPPAPAAAPRPNRTMAIGTTDSPRPTRSPGATSGQPANTTDRGQETSPDASGSAPPTSLDAACYPGQE
ncbi:MAG TPA: LCP family protein [Pseudonocardiaceae bacterium]|jgi:LCP family protein required for cell wall assembly|nr:LCP family protein [Pseudonocardiaceae bacterium]